MKPGSGLCCPIFHPGCLVSSGVLGAMVCIVRVASTQDFAGSPLPRRQREAQRSGVSLSLGCRGFWNQPRFSSPDLQSVLLLWKTGRPLPQPWERQTLLPKRFSSYKAVWFCNSRFDFKKKKKRTFLKGHINLLCVYLCTYLQASMRMFCFKSLHMKGKIQGKCCSKALGYRWFQRISQGPSEQAKARWV